MGFVLIVIFLSSSLRLKGFSVLFSEYVLFLAISLNEIHFRSCFYFDKELTQSEKLLFSSQDLPSQVLYRQKTFRFCIESASFCALIACNI